MRESNEIEMEPGSLKCYNLAEITACGVYGGPILSATSRFMLQCLEAKMSKKDKKLKKHSKNGAKQQEKLKGTPMDMTYQAVPSVPPEDAGLLTLLAGAAWAETAREVANVDATAKWPNDLLVGEAKAGGMLAESRVVEGRLEVVILGSGINLEPPEIDGPVAGLGADADPADLLVGFLVRFRAGYEVEPPRFSDEVRARWRAVAATLGRDVEAARTDGVPIRGRAVDIDARGGLVLDTRDGLAVVSFGEVVHLT